jgi:hypothetical protein
MALMSSLKRLRYLSTSTAAPAVLVLKYLTSGTKISEDISRDQHRFAHSTHVLAKAALPRRPPGGSFSYVLRLDASCAQDAGGGGGHASD